ncbi:ATP-binding protein [Romboutsia maritimum]|uniref:Iron-sulfur cluster carrier protein n=1 Tax=Romboutsia maritimum TaxID=2020948 RepID=A0A371IT52_9FIRM|nr:Mrp/NBP35 family ATP-binding protein [Romboutsia maritimum]RDY23667.1 ATP-binding protein [Romboutsia maritimum]
MSNCNSCPSNGSCSKDKSSCAVENNTMNNIKNVIGVMSGKGGVGKSTISALIAKNLSKKGYKVGVLDADITGPSIPRLLGIKNEKAKTSEQFIFPVETKDRIKVMSLNLLIENENEPVIWRGAMISNAVKQFWTDVLWEELDYLIIDMPPGTGDVPLTVMQSIPINGIVMISVPQDMVSMIVSKAVNMVRKMDIDIIGVVENMSYIQCPDCNKKIKIFDGEKNIEFLDKMNLNLLGELPMISSIGNISINGSITDKDTEKMFDSIVTNMINSMKEKESIMQ